MVEWVIIAGGTVTAAVDAILEAYSGEWFPQYAGKPLFGFEPLPPLDDWVVLGIPAAVYLVGHFAKKASVKNFGLGGLLYAGPMIIHHIIFRAKAHGVGWTTTGTSTSSASAFKTRSAKLQELRAK
jgi:hypothetical protein